MFGLWKKAISPQQAAQAFIAHMAQVTDDTYRIWLQTFLQSLASAGIASKKIEKVLGPKDVKLIYFAAVFALQLLAIRNCFPAGTSAALHQAVGKELEVWSGIERRIVVDLSFGFLHRMDAQLSAMGNLPYDEAAIFTMELLEFDKHKDTKALFMNPVFIASVGMALLTAVPGWWKPLSERAKIKL